MNTKKTPWILLILLSLFLGACRSANPEAPTTPQMEANAVYTAAAQTAEARMTEIAAITPSPLPPTATHTPAPATATPAPTTPAVDPTAAPTQASSGADLATYVADITVPDGTDFKPGEEFTKTWQLKNTGTTTWSTAYSLVFAAGEQMGDTFSVPLSGQVAPGQTVNISVELTAPSKSGTHRGYWRMSNASGKLFDSSIYVEIEVLGSDATATGTSASTTPGAGTATATSSPDDLVSSLTLNVDEDEVKGACPHTFTISAQFTLNEAATVTYKLLAGADNFTIDELPAPVSSPLGAGSHSLIYTLDIDSSGSGWAQLEISEPEVFKSNKVNFSLECE